MNALNEPHYARHPQSLIRTKFTQNSILKIAYKLNRILDNLFSQNFTETVRDAKQAAEKFSVKTFESKDQTACFLDDRKILVESHVKRPISV